MFITFEVVFSQDKYGYFQTSIKKGDIEIHKNEMIELPCTETFMDVVFEYTKKELLQIQKLIEIEKRQMMRITATSAVKGDTKC